jgi:hypothetical protein
MRTVTVPANSARNAEMDIGGNAAAPEPLAPVSRRPRAVGEAGGAVSVMPPSSARLCCALCLFVSASVTVGASRSDQLRCSGGTYSKVGPAVVVPSPEGIFIRVSAWARSWYMVPTVLLSPAGLPLNASSSW